MGSQGYEKIATLAQGMADKTPDFPSNSKARAQRSQAIPLPNEGVLYYRGNEFRVSNFGPTEIYGSFAVDFSGIKIWQYYLEGGKWLLISVLA